MLKVIFLIFAIIYVIEGAAPPHFQVTFQTTVNQGKGQIVLDIQRQWAPLGVDRFYELLTLNNTFSYYANNGFFRVISGFVVQFGINGIPSVSAKWANASIQDDPVVLSNLEGTIAYADAGPDTRTTQLFINFANNTYLDQDGFAPFGKVIKGMDVALGIYSQYGEDSDQQSNIYQYGNSYLKENFPDLDYITSTKVVVVNE